MPGNVSSKATMSVAIRTVTLVLLLIWSISSVAGGSDNSTESPVFAAEAYDRLIRIADIIEKDLNAYGTPAILLGRSSSGAERFGHEFGHSAIAVRNASGHWVVRHLYIVDATKNETVPGISEVGFGNYLYESGYVENGYVFALVLPEPWGQRLEAASRDNALVLSLLNPSYSPIAYPFSTQYQNCNQWVLELAAAAFADEASPIQTRAQAQEWLRQQSYQPTELTFNPFKQWAVRRIAAAFFHEIPEDDHPSQAVAAGSYRFTMPNSLAEFVQRKLPATKRLDYCYSGNTVIARKPGVAFEPGCTPRPTDRVTQLED